MNRQFLTAGVFPYGMLVLLSMMAGCSKSINTLDDPKFVTLNIYVKTIDTLQLKVTAGEEVLTQSVVTPNGEAHITFQHSEPGYRFGLYDVFAHRLMLDTLISMNTIRTTGRMVFFQPEPGGDIVWVGPPPASEPLPAQDSAKMAVVYTYAALPDRVKVVVENSVGNTNTYHATDSFLLRKGEFSRYFTGNRTAGGRKLQLRLYTPDADRTLVATVNNSFSTLNNRFYVFAFRTGNLAAGVYTLTPDNLY